MISYIISCSARFQMWVCWRRILWYPHKQNLADYLEPYMSYNQYIPVCTWYVPVQTSMYYLVHLNPSEHTSFWLLTMGKDTVCTGQVCGGVQELKQGHTSLAWQSYMSSYQYILISTLTIVYITYQYVLCTYQYILVHTGMYQIPWFRTTGRDSTWPMRSK